MTHFEIDSIINEQIKGRKDLSYDNGQIVFLYDKEEYRIDWDNTHNFRYGYVIEFWCDFINNFTIGRKTIGWREIKLTEDSLYKSHKNINKKINVLIKRIKEQKEINDFVKKNSIEDEKKVFKYLGKELGIKDFKDIKFLFNVKQDWTFYREWNSNKIVRSFRNFTYTLTFKYEDKRYNYNYMSYHPSKWNDTELIKIVLTSKYITNLTPLKITNRIRYAKLKNLFDKNGTD